MILLTCGSSWGADQPRAAANDACTKQWRYGGGSPEEWKVCTGSTAAAASLLLLAVLAIQDTVGWWATDNWHHLLAPRRRVCVVFNKSLQALHLCAVHAEGGRELYARCFQAASVPDRSTRNGALCIVWQNAVQLKRWQAIVCCIRGDAWISY